MQAIDDPPVLPGLSAALFMDALARHAVELHLRIEPVWLGLAAFPALNFLPAD